jgi:hypothetical protein
MVFNRLSLHNSVSENRMAAQGQFLQAMVAQSGIAGNAEVGFAD